MTTLLAQNEDLLTGWINRQPTGTVARRGPSTASAGGLRFAFYGRISTSDFQDRTSSSTWQREAASELIAGHGTITAEFFDVGCSRRRGWHGRPQAAALMTLLADPHRGFDAVVVGEYERAFCGDQLVTVLPLFDRHGVQLWLPETNGSVDMRSSTHHALIMLLGAQSKREVLRARFRVTAAMQAQARDQGRYLGGRPPYGYRLVDAGPHPNTAHSRWGRRLQRLEPDPITAPQVRQIFAWRLAGHSVAGIARALNESDIACPSSVDPDRNRHRKADGWTLRTVAAILANPHYTGRQVWNRQRTDREPAAGGRGDREVMRWNRAADWVISKTMAHTGLVSEADFIAAQAVRAARPTGNGTTRTYLLAGLVLCRRCGRRMDAHWVNNRPGYRCRHGHTSAKRAANDRPKTVYWREDKILQQLATDLDGAGSSEDPHEIARFLRSGRTNIVCDEVGCTLSSDVPPLQAAHG